MGYKKYAKDYEIEYVPQPGKKRDRAVRIYVGPYFQFRVSAERVRLLRWLYLAGVMTAFFFLLLPMSLNGALSRIWYVQIPAAAAWIPWVLVAASVWRLWTAKEKMEREHNDLLGGRMSGACLFLMILSGISAAGGVYAMVTTGGTAEDWLVPGCMICVCVCGALLFARRKELATVEVENPEKPQGKKHNA